MLMIAFHFVWIHLLVLFAGGLVLLHFSGKSGSMPLKVGGIVLVAGAILSTLCVLYYAARYMEQGAFQTPHPMMMQKMGGMMGPGMVRPGMMEGGRRMDDGDADADADRADEPASEHEH